MDMKVGETMKKVIILGGGISGLAAGYKLLKAGAQVEIYEKRPRGGGFADTLVVEGKKIERYYHHFFKSDTHLIQLIQELGLRDQVRWLPSSMGYFSGGKVYDFGTPVSLLKFKPLSIFGKVGFGLSTLQLLIRKDWRALEEISAEKWLRKKAGNEAFEVIWEPLLKSKFGEKASQVSMAWFWGKIKLRGSSKENGKEVLGYLDGSLEKLTDELIRRIEELGGIIHFNKEVLSLKKLENGDWTGTVTHGTFRGNRVLGAIPQPVFNRLLPEKQIEVEHTSVICGLFVMNRSLTGKYWLNIGEKGMPFGGLIEHTNLLEKEEYGGKHLLYISSYMLAEDERYTMSDDDLLDLYYENLKKVNPEFQKEWVESAHLYRSRYAQPIISLGYSKVKPVHTLGNKNAGLFQTSMAIIYPEDRGVNYAIRDSFEAAEAVLKSF